MSSLQSTVLYQVFLIEIGGFLPWELKLARVIRSTFFTSIWIESRLSKINAMPFFDFNSITSFNLLRKQRFELPTFHLSSAVSRTSKEGKEESRSSKLGARC